MEEGLSNSCRSKASKWLRASARAPYTLWWSVEFMGLVSTPEVYPRLRRESHSMDKIQIRIRDLNSLWLLISKIVLTLENVYYFVLPRLRVRTIFNSFYLSAADARSLTS